MGHGGEGCGVAATAGARPGRLEQAVEAFEAGGCFGPRSLARGCFRRIRRSSLLRLTRHRHRAASAAPKAPVCIKRGPRQPEFYPIYCPNRSISPLIGTPRRGPVARSVAGRSPRITNGFCIRRSGGLFCSVVDISLDFASNISFKAVHGLRRGGKVNKKNNKQGEILVLWHRQR